MQILHNKKTIKFKRPKKKKNIYFNFFLKLTFVFTNVFLLPQSFVVTKNTTTLQFTINNRLHSFVTQVFIDLVIPMNNFLKTKMKKINKLGNKKKRQKN